MARNVLVTSDVVGEEDLKRLSKSARVYTSWKMDEESLDRILPEIDVLLIFMWPRFLTAEALRRMRRLKFLQSILVGVNHIPFQSIGEDVVVASNAGAYSLEVGEHAWALLLAAAKSIVVQHVRVRGGAKALSEFSGEARKNTVLDGRTLGVVGYGSIGRSIRKYAEAFGMEVIGFGRGRKAPDRVRYVSGGRGLETLLRVSDAVLLSIPLTRSTAGLIGEKELSLMKDDAILVNVARGDLVDEKALYSRLTSHPSFRYATDAWWYKEGRETLETDFPFATLPNFVGTPHMSGPTGVLTGRPGKLAAENVLRYLKGRRPKHVVGRSEYLGM